VRGYAARARRLCDGSHDVVRCKLLLNTLEPAVRRCRLGAVSSPVDLVFLSMATHATVLSESIPRLLAIQEDIPPSPNAEAWLILLPLLIVLSTFLFLLLLFLLCILVIRRRRGIALRDADGSRACKSPCVEPILEQKVRCVWNSSEFIVDADHLCRISAAIPS
jgi:hypothetical protein